jgi:GGDEF domain-containing protein
MQVMTNLLDNAIKFTENGFVEVSLIERDSYVECVIRDSGLGISENDLPKVFNKFQQFGRQAGAGAKGTGLGLVIAKAIVEMHKGKISVESLYGKGTTFKFILPIYTYDTLVKEYAEAGIKKAHDNNANFSLIVIKVRDIEKLNQMLEPDKIQGLLKDLEGVIKGGLRGAGDTALNNSGEYSIFLNDCGKENALRIEGRIEQMIDEYFSSFDLKERVHLKFICTTYPDEAKSAQEFIVKAKKGEQGG